MPVTVKLPADIILLEASIVLAIIPPKYVAPPEDDIVPDNSRHGPRFPPAGTEITRVLPSTIGPDEDIVPFVTVTAPWLTKDPVIVAPS